MGVSCGATIIKYLLFLFNVLWLVLGGVVLWLGIKVTIWSGSLSDIYENNLRTGSIIILAAGVLIFLLAFLGCCGACRESACMLSTYGAIILLLVIAQCVGAYFAFKYKTDIPKEINKIIEKGIEKFQSEDSVAKGIQEIQRSFECCGTDGPNSWRVKTGGRVPASCCDEWSSGDSPHKLCSDSMKIKFTEGCAQKVTNILNKYVGGLGGVAIALVLIQLLIILSACCLAREVRN
ncbi:23 kDa integral membrane protein-like [Oppia nitens]|uniref:23 kDa integral membrane protein-like n=1 Tax=Oppia nitens TaxID=1686743 RepID=UPI0023DA96A6|nr:23 kDa integral membrane protein-like [Oppia nitens]